jgi:hypothetical protein
MYSKEDPNSLSLVLKHVCYLWISNLYGPYVMVLMRADSLRGKMGGGWALEIKAFLGPVT